MSILFGTLMCLVAIFIILLVLVQRGRGGGLAGAMGGAGGQSAFGAKAGDMFTRITVVTAAVWILLCMIAVKTLRSSAADGPDASFGKNAATSPEESQPSVEKPAPKPGSKPDEGND